MKNLKRSMKAGLIFVAVGAGRLVYSSDVDSVKKKGDTPPKLILAILIEDIKLYSREMSRLLNQPIAEFKEAVSFKTEQGDAIFHLMAGAQFHQEFFTKEMKALTRLLYPNNFNQSKEESKVSLGGVDIEIPFLEDTELGQAIYNRDLRALVSIASQLEKEPVVKLLQYLQARTRAEAWRDFEKLIFSSFSGEDLLYLRDQKAVEKFQKYITSLSQSFHKIQNRKGLLPEDIAYAEHNLSAFDLLSNLDKLEKDSLRDKIHMSGAVTGTVIGATIGTLGGAALVFNSFKDLSAGHFDGVALSSFGGAALGLAVGALASEKCYKLFQEQKSKRMSSNKASAI